MRITIVRHGETYQNRSRTVQGQSDSLGRLTRLGVLQAELCGEALRQEEFDAVFCSPLERSMLTMAAIVERLNSTLSRKIIFADELMEIDLGILEGQPHHAWKVMLGEHDPATHCPENGESWVELFERVQGYFKEHVLTSGYTNILIVGHGGVNRALIGSVINMPIKQAWRPPGEGIPQHNACINYIKLNTKNNPSTLTEAIVNSTKHLSSIMPASTAGQRWLGHGWEMLDEEDHTAASSAEGQSHFLEKIFK